MHCNQSVTPFKAAFLSLSYCSMIRHNAKHATDNLTRAHLTNIHTCSTAIQCFQLFLTGEENLVGLFRSFNDGKFYEKLNRV